MVDIVEEQDNELDELLEMNGPFMSNQEYYKYNKSKYEASQGGGGGALHRADINTTCVDVTLHNHEPPIDQAHRKTRDYQSELYEKKVEDIFKRNLSDSVDNEEVLSVEILDGQNEALNYQKILNDNQMFLKDIKTTYTGSARLMQQNSQCNDCDSRASSYDGKNVVMPSYDVRNVTSPSYAVSQYESHGGPCDCHPSSTSNTFSVNPRAHIGQEVNASPGVYDYACNCKVRHTPASESYDEDSLEVTIPDVVPDSHDLFSSGQMSSQCILENYQNMYNDIRLGQVTSGFSQCDAAPGENEYYRYGNQTEYFISDRTAGKPRLPEEAVHQELQKRLGNGLRIPSA